MACISASIDLTVAAGKKPASATPKNHRAARRPEYECTRPIKVMTRPQLKSKIVIQIEGRMILRTMLDGTSKRVYGTKNNVTAALYCRPWSFKSSFNPAIFAFPTKYSQVLVECRRNGTYCWNDL